MPFPLPFPSHIVLSAQPGSFASTTAAGLPRYAGSVTVRIDNDDSGVFSVSSLETLELVHDPDLPPGSRPVWETTGTQDGAGPMSLGAAQALAVSIGFACPAGSNAATFTATASVVSVEQPARTVLTIPLMATVLLVPGSVTLEATSVPALHAGAIADFGFRLTSTLTHGVGGILTCDTHGSTPFSADTDPQFPLLEAGTAVDVVLPVACAPGTAAGRYPVDFRFFAIDNSAQYAALEVAVSVLEDRAVTVSASFPPALTVEQASANLCELRVDVTGGPTSISIAPSSIPAGVTLSGGTQSVGVDGTVFLGISVDIDPHAPAGPNNVPLRIDWSVPADDLHPAVSGTLSFELAISLVTAVYVPQNEPMNSGEVQASNVRAAFNSNGDWTLSAHLHDFSTIFGDNFAIGMVFDYTDGACHGPSASGVLGSSLTRNPESLVVGVQGNDPWLRENWQQAFAGGALFRLHHSGDLGQVISDLGDDFKNAAHEIYIALEQIGSCPVDENGDPQCTDPGTEPGDGG